MDEEKDQPDEKRDRLMQEIKDIKIEPKAPGIPVKTQEEQDFFKTHTKFCIILVILIAIAILANLIYLLWF